jgi:hypothetical protein
VGLEKMGFKKKRRKKNRHNNPQVKKKVLATQIKLKFR